MLLFKQIQTNRNYVVLDMAMKNKKNAEASAPFKMCFSILFFEKCLSKKNLNYILIFFLLTFSSLVDPNF